MITFLPLPALPGHLTGHDGQGQGQMEARPLLSSAPIPVEQRALCSATSPLQTAVLLADTTYQRWEMYCVMHRLLYQLKCFIFLSALQYSTSLGFLVSEICKSKSERGHQNKGPSKELND